MNFQVAKKTNKPAYQRPITVLFLLQLLLLVKLLSFLFSGGVMGCGEQVTNWHYFIQSSFALHSLHFELSRISLSVSLEHQQDLYHVLIDFKKAFDRVWHKALWSTMRLCNINNLIQVIENLYNKATSAVYLNGDIGDWFRTTVGVRQRVSTLTNSFQHLSGENYD